MSSSLQLWKNSHVRENRTWEFALSGEQRNEIVATTRAAIADGATLDSISREHFQIPGLKDVVEKINRDLSQGLGFVLLKRFPVDLLTQEESELAYFGLGLHLGVPVRQNSNSELLSHIRDDRTKKKAKLFVCTELANGKTSIPMLPTSSAFCACMKQRVVVKAKL